MAVTMKQSAITSTPARRKKATKKRAPSKRLSSAAVSASYGPKRGRK